VKLYAEIFDMNAKNRGLSNNRQTESTLSRHDNNSSRFWLFVISCSVVCDKLEEMTAENSTANESPALNTRVTYDYISPTAAFLVPARQLGNAVQFYFQYAIIGIGIFGTAANALVLYGLVAYHGRATK